MQARKMPVPTCTNNIILNIYCTSGEMHFDIHPDAFKELMGQTGYNAGTGYVTYKEVASSNCRGNKG
jgi:hypothetical protein